MVVAAVAAGLAAWVAASVALSLLVGRWIELGHRGEERTREGEASEREE